MYEISLVPEVKAQLLRKQRMRNLVILICIGVALACGVILALLGSMMGMQSVRIGNNETTIACLYNGEPKGNAKCKKTGTPILKFSNIDTLLAIQDQLHAIDTLNNSKYKFSRIFGLLDVLLINDPQGARIDVNDVTVDFSTATISFAAVGKENVPGGAPHYVPLEAFEKHAKRMYYDFGDYMRLDADDNYVPIPVYCISEVENDGVVYGVYHKGTPGCEAPMVKQDAEGHPLYPEGTKLEGEEGEKLPEKIEHEDIYIRRTYYRSDDQDKVKNGEIIGSEENRKFLKGKKVAKGFYFDSECIQYNDKGEFDSDATKEACPLLEDESQIAISGQGLGRNEETGEQVLTFNASVTVAKDIFSISSHHVQISGPSRRNVTDSYLQIRDMFTQTDNITKLEEGEGEEGK